ncbi:CT20-domain-containing protein [Lentithecium fluviatile CBS 122367]|uniref:CT20-domain-containing protein n=1 Tax=Lentithecium fluviatile CBS 122367 TaxID=1168545 RepID=A0A6G1J0B5_9PLEO|nr:CT20-domain-containing protein [Lentithecium fluviatile CBS 122367]
MPPRKKAKASAASTPLADAQPRTPQDSGAAASQAHDEPAGDVWADDQETQLFKSMMKWKPTGLHKHFRMISIHADMRSHGFASDDAPHTRIPGIWRKLHHLYDLRALDERENAYAFSEEPDPTDPAEAAAMPEFELPEDDFGELMWQRRFHGPESLAASSPPLMPTEDDKALYQPGLGLLKDLPHGLRSQKAESVPDATPTPKNQKATRASRAAAKGSKGAKGQAAKNNKAQSAVSESAEDEDEEDEEQESSAESEEDTAPSTRRTNRSAAKARPAPKRTRKR